MPQYRVTTHEVCGVKAGGVVTLTEFEAGGFMDKLELLETEPAAPVVQVETEPAQPPDYLKTLSTLGEWLETAPDVGEVERALVTEKLNKNRQGAIDALEEYLNVD